MMYETTDKVKTFHRTLLLSDVLAEREKQRVYKARRTGLQAEADAAYIVQVGRRPSSLSIYIF